jgi:hypothetical protein
MNIKYYSEEQPDWDKTAVRFETNARPIARYAMPCVALTLPYTPLTWLMVNFLQNHALADPQGLAADRQSFWKLAERCAMFQYERIINNSTVDRSRTFLRNMSTIRELIVTNGFNLAKPVPVTENPRGEIVPLKGAKRIAALITLGVETVPVREYDFSTLNNLPSDQSLTGCVDHAELIFGNLADLPEVSSLRVFYDYMNRRGPMLDDLSSPRPSAVCSIPEELTALLSRQNPTLPIGLTLVVKNEVEYGIWLAKRNVSCRVISLELYEKDSLPSRRELPLFTVKHFSRTRHLNFLQAEAARDTLFVSESARSTMRRAGILIGNATPSRNNAQ